MEVEQAVRELGLKRIRRRGDQISACCPLHTDRHPSFSIHADRGVWICHRGCGSGNLFQLLQRLDRHDLWEGGQGRAPYERTTDRTSGDIASIVEQLRWTQWMIQQGYRREDILTDLQERFEISRSTAYDRFAWLKGKQRVYRDERGRLHGRRSAYCLRLVREQSKEHRIAVNVEKGKWARRSAVLRSYLRLINQEVKYGPRGRVGAITTAHDMVEKAQAWLLIPRPPPEIGCWTPSETAILTDEVTQRQRHGVSLIAPWEIELLQAA